MADMFYCKRQGVEVGPLAGSELQRLARNGEITPDCLIRKGSSDKWILASRVQGLFNETRSPDKLLDADPYYEVFYNNKIKKINFLDDVRDLLLAGKLTRHHLVRYIGPLPGSLSDDVRQTLIQEWKVRREWRPIGEGLARWEFQIQVLYEPELAYDKEGQKVVHLTVFSVLLVTLLVLIWVFWEIPKPTPDQIRGAKGFWERLLLDPVHKKAAFSVAAISFASGAGWVLAPFGGTFGRMVGRRRIGLLPTPPDDGYVPPTPVQA
jgi:hypothetical protein